MAQHDRLHRPRGRAPVVLAAAGTITLLTGLVSLQLARGQEAAGWVLGMTAAALLLVGTTLTQLARTTLRVPGSWPVVAVLAALTGEAVVRTARLSVASEASSSTGVTLTTAAAALGSGLILVALLVAVTGRRPSPLAWGGALGLLLAAAASPTGGDTGPHELWSATALLLVHGVLAVVVTRAWPWSTGTGAGLATTIVSIGAAGALAELSGPGQVATAATAAGLVAGGTAGLIAATVAWRDLVARTPATTAPDGPDPAEEAQRERAEQHALRNMAAGISMASELLEDDDLEEPVRRRLEHTIHEEAQQLCRLLDSNGDSNAGATNGTSRDRLPTAPRHGPPQASSPPSNPPSSPPSSPPSGQRHQVQVHRTTGEIRVDC